jgi:hypothetical protein
MIYTSLRILPMVLFDEILSSNNYELLSDEPNLTDLDKEQLKLLWDELNEQYQEKYNKASKNKYFNVDKEVAYQSGRYAVINSICDSLLFAKEQRLIDILIEEGYRVRESNYLEDIERAKKQTQGIIIKINTLIDSLPKKDPNKTESEYSIIDIMAGYVSVLGFDFDFYTISVEKFKSLEKTVQNKLKAMEKTKPTKKK